MVNFPPIGRFIPTRDEPDEGVICKLLELDRLIMTGGSAVPIQGEE